jgi:predicted permease
MRTLKFAFRTLVRTPLVTGVAILSLALGIGANAAVFSLFNQILIRPLPVHNPGALVNLSAPGPKPGANSTNNAGGNDDVFSYPMFRDLDQAQTVFTGMAAHRNFDVNLAARGQTLNASGMFVSGSYFPVLGLKAVLGRLISPEDDRAPGASPVAVLSHAYWQARFGSDPGVVGDTLVVNGQTLTIVGVAPPKFNGTTLGTAASVFVPITMREALQPSPRRASLTSRISYWVYVFARLKPGVSLEGARTAINAPYHSIITDVEAPLQRGMTEATRARFLAKTIGVAAGAHGQSTIGEARTPLTLLFGVAGLVLLIACANVANLQLARSAGRASEMAIRLSIGAGRRHLIAQLLTESCLLAVLGGGAGLIVARWTLDFIATLAPADSGNVFDPHLDVSILLFSGALALGTGLLFGLFPALKSTRPDLVSTLKSQAGQSAGGRSASRFRTTLATTQVALSMTLLVAAGLFIRSLVNVNRVDLGFDMNNVVTFGVSPALNGYTAALSTELFERIESELKALPGTTGVTGATVPVLADDNTTNNVTVEGFHPAPGEGAVSSMNDVGGDYFHVLRIPILAGRDLSAADVAGASRVVVVNEAFAKRFNMASPGNAGSSGNNSSNVQGVIGKHMAVGAGGALDYLEIVGIARNAKYSDAKEAVPPLFFRPYRQVDNVRALVFYVRVAREPEAFLANIPKMMSRLDPNLPVEGLRTLPDQFRENVFLDRFMTILSAAFALLATLLAAIGLYGVLAYTVIQRTREIGVRMALGATPGGVCLLMLRQVARMTILGCAIGGAGALALGQYAQALLFELKGYDPIVLASSAVALAAVALSAGAIPAYRASRVDPLRALRYE